MVAAAAVGAPVISAWAAVSPFGLSGADLAAGLRAGRLADRRLDPEEWSVPYDRACVVPDFGVREFLGRQGTRSMDRATGLAVAAIRQLLTGERAEPDAARLAGVGEGTGLALGTSTGSAQSIMDFTRDSLVGARPFYVDPARFPNTVLNCAAGQSAIWHRLKGPNATVAGGRAAGLLALRYALRLQRAGRATTVLCGAVEEFSSARAWLEWHAGQDGAESAEVLGEGAAVWLLEPGGHAEAHGREGLAEVAGLEFGFAESAEEVRPVLAEVVGRLLERSGVAPEKVWALADSRAPGRSGEGERAALADVLGGHEPLRLAAGDAVGDTCAASAAFQIAAVLCLAERGEAPPGSPALVTSVDRDGVVGAALLLTR